MNADHDSGPCVPIILGRTTWTCAKMWRRVTVAEGKAQDHLAYGGSALRS